MSQQPISAEARGKLRAWKEHTQARFEAIDRARLNLFKEEHIPNMVLRSSIKGRARAFDKIRERFSAATLEGVRLDGANPIAVWAVLKPRAPVVIDAEAPPHLLQSCVVVEYLVAGALPTAAAGVAAGLWSLEIPDHALGRLLDRSPRELDLGAVLMHAHHAALRARLDDTEIRAALASRRAFLLPAGAGAFRCEFRCGADVSQGEAISAHLFAHTWLHQDQLFSDQQLVRLDEALPGERLGDGLLLPVPLRRLIAEGDNTVRIHRWAPGMPETLARPRGRA